MSEKVKKDELDYDDVHDVICSKLDDPVFTANLRKIEHYLGSNKRQELEKNFIYHNSDYSINTKEEARPVDLAVLFDLIKRVQQMKDDHNDMTDKRANDAIRQILYCDSFIRYLTDLNKLLKVDVNELYQFLFNEEPQKQKIYN